MRSVAAVASCLVLLVSALAVFPVVEASNQPPPCSQQCWPPKPDPRDYVVLDGKMWMDQDGGIYFDYAAGAKLGYAGYYAFGTVGVRGDGDLYCEGGVWVGFRPIYPYTCD